MNNCAPFDESKVCLNCPMDRCVHDGKKGERSLSAHQGKAR